MISENTFDVHGWSLGCPHLSPSARMARCRHTQGHASFLGQGAPTMNGYTQARCRALQAPFLLEESFLFFLLQDSHTVAIGFFKLLTAFYSCPDTTPDCHGGTRLKNIKYPLKCCLMHVKHRLLETTSTGKLNNSTERFWFYLSAF